MTSRTSPWNRPENVSVTQNVTCAAAWKVAQTLRSNGPRVWQSVPQCFGKSRETHSEETSLHIRSFGCHRTHRNQYGSGGWNQLQFRQSLRITLLRRGVQWLPSQPLSLTIPQILFPPSLLLPRHQPLRLPPSGVPATLQPLPLRDRSLLFSPVGTLAPLIANTLPVQRCRLIESDGAVPVR